MPQVGDIRQISAADDPERKEGLFAVELNTRVYTLRAKTDAEADLWVRTLLQLRNQNENSNVDSSASTSSRKANTVQSFEVDNSNSFTTKSGASGGWKKAPTNKFICC